MEREANYTAVGAFVLLILLVSILPMVVYVRYTRTAEESAS